MTDEIAIPHMLDGAPDLEIVQHFIRLCRTEKPVGQWPGERLCGAIERLLAQQPAPSAPVGVEEALRVFHGHESGPAEWPDPRNHEYNENQRERMAAVLDLAQQPAAVDERIRNTAWHIGKAVEYIDKQWPHARLLDRGLILRNMRRWHAQLTAALSDKQQEVR